MANSDKTDESILVETEWLADHLDLAGLKIVAMDYGPGFAKGHIPGAVSVRNNYLKSASDTNFLMELPEFKELMETLGIGDDTLVIGYDNNGSLYASRLWWMLMYYGHPNVKILNGGWLKWVRENRPIIVKPTFPRERGSVIKNDSSKVVFTPRLQPALASSVDLLKVASETREEKIWDIRSKAEYKGENGRGNARVGHVPNAQHLEWLDFMNGDNTFKSSDEMRNLLSGIGIDSKDTVHIY